MENFGQTLMPVSALLLLLLQRQQAYVCFIDFQKTYEMVCFINLVLKSRALSHRPDSEHILEMLCVVKINSHCMKFFICMKGLHQGCTCHLTLTFQETAF